MRPPFRGGVAVSACGEAAVALRIDQAAGGDQTRLPLDGKWNVKCRSHNRLRGQTRLIGQILKQ